MVGFGFSRTTQYVASGFLSAVARSAKADSRTVAVVLLGLAGCTQASPPVSTGADPAASAQATAPKPHVSVAQGFLTTEGSAKAISPARLVSGSRLSMGSALRLTAWTSDQPGAQAAFDEVFAEFARLEKLMSTWIADSDVQRVNQAAGLRRVQVSADVRDVLKAARQISEWTGGKFDVTFGALSGLWKFDHDQDNVAPDLHEVRRRLPLIDYRAIQIDDAAGTVFLARKGMFVHLGGIGKGFAIDRSVNILRRRGFRDFMIQSGGDVYVSGLKAGRPWRLGIQDPRGPANQSFAELDLSDGTFSTSGDYERFFIKDGRRYHHILDPATGEPARGSRSVTIVANLATIADGLSTGVFILGPEAGMALIERLPDVEGVIVSDKNDVIISSGLTGRVRLLAK
jgi:FAD:protein FMN transferase